MLKGKLVLGVKTNNTQQDRFTHILFCASGIFSHLILIPQRGCLRNRIELKNPGMEQSPHLITLPGLESSCSAITEDEIFRSSKEGGKISVSNVPNPLPSGSNCDFVVSEK